MWFNLDGFLNLLRRVWALKVFGRHWQRHAHVWHHGLPGCAGSPTLPTVQMVGHCGKVEIQRAARGYLGSLRRGNDCQGAVWESCSLREGSREWPWGQQGPSLPSEGAGWTWRWWPDLTRSQDPKSISRWWGAPGVSLGSQSRGEGQDQVQSLMDRALRMGWDSQGWQCPQGLDSYVCVVRVFLETN